MKHIIVYVLTVLLMFSSLIQPTEAARFGGGRSFGVQRSHSSLFSSRPSQSTKSYAPRSTSTRKWGGILGGFLAGSLLASLFMGHGLGSGLLSWLILGVLGYAIFALLRKKVQPAYQTPQQQHFQQTTAESIPSAAFDTTSNINIDAFLRTAKTTFMRLQAAYDQKNLQDLREFTAPDICAEIQMQWQEQGDTANQTVVGTLQAELLDISKQAYGTIASVHFTGTITENGINNTLDEIWHFRQLAADQPWLVVGIQQEVHEPQ